MTALTESEWHYKVTGPNNADSITSNVGDLVNFEFDATAPAYVWGNMKITFDPSLLECVAIEENPNSWGFWTWWTTATGMAQYGGGGTYYRYHTYEGMAANAWTAQWVAWYGENNAGPVGTYDNAAGVIRIYTSTYAGGMYGATPLRLVFKIKQIGNAIFTIGSNDFTEYDWNNLPVSDESTVNIGANKTQTTTQLSAAPNPAAVGDTVTLTATVAPAAATGTVTFYENGVALPNGVVTVVNGVATYSTNTLSAGAHTITATYSGDANHQASSGSVTVIVIDIASVSWVGVPVSGVTNFEAGGNPDTHGGGDRIFAEQNDPGVGATLYDKIALRITLDRPVPAGTTFTVWYRIFDVDDTTQNRAAGAAQNPADANDRDPAVDPATYQGGDNRPAAGGMSDEIGSVTFAAGESAKTSNVITITARQPGNNWKALVGFTQAQVNAAALNEAIPNGEDRVLSFLWAAGGAQAPLNYQSPLLSVWRKLHVEVDSMAAVTGNEARGMITGLTAGANAATVTVSFGSLDDGSPNLTAGTGNGRFENGWISVGSGAGAISTPGLRGNGNDFFQMPAGGAIQVPFVLVNASNEGTRTGTITNIPGSGMVFGVSTPLTPRAYNGGTITVAGTVFRVDQNAANTVKTTTPIQIPYTAHDDDDDTLLPVDPPDTALIKSQMEQKFALAYILPVFDGGGTPTNNSTNVPFALNAGTITQPSDLVSFIGSAIQSDGNRSNDFWAAYVMHAFQSTKGSAVAIGGRADGDPDSESPLSGITTAFGGIGSILFREEAREYVRKYSLPVTLQEYEAANFVHEVGHQFNLGHPASGIMSAADFWKLDSIFVPSDINCIRGNPASPGRRFVPDPDPLHQNPWGIPCN